MKLKSVGTLLRIACLADRKFCAISCEKLTKSEIGSSGSQILLKITSIACSQEVISAQYEKLYDNMHASVDTAH